MDTKIRDYSEIEGPLNQAATILAAQRDQPWSRTIQVRKELENGGDIKLSSETVEITLARATSGSPIDLICHILDTIEWKEDVEKVQREERIAEAKEEAEYWIKYLMKKLPPDDFQDFIEITIGLG